MALEVKQLVDTGGTTGHVLAVQADDTIASQAAAGSGSGETFDGWGKLEEAGGTASIDDSFNISSIVDNGVGDITVNWDTDFSTANYAAVATAGNNGEQAGMQQVQNHAVGSCTIRTFNGPGEASAREHISIVACGD